MTSARETGGVHPSVCVRGGGGGAAVEETLVTHAERVTGGKRSCEGAAVTACTVAAERWMKGGRSTLWGKHDTCKVCSHATRTCSQITRHMTETLPGFMECLFFRKGGGGGGIYSWRREGGGVVLRAEGKGGRGSRSLTVAQERQAP